MLFHWFTRNAMVRIIKFSGLGLIKTRIGDRSIATSSKLLSLKKTPLHELHVQNGGKMVPFAGFSMPLDYANESISSSHLHVRAVGGLFDVSHMLQSIISGANRVKLLESISVGDVANLPAGSSLLSLITNENGGIEDDCIITNAGDYIYLVTNAGCIDKDKRILEEAKDTVKSVNIEYIQSSHALIAVQGPKVASILQKGIASYDLTDQRFMTSRVAEVAGIKECRVTRCGYTGEDGFEISVESSEASKLVDFFLNTSDTSGEKIKLVGLGARDTLRLEAGLCLYGNDIDSTTSPVEAALAWTIGKRRRTVTPGDESNVKFPGHETIMKQLAQPGQLVRKRVGLMSVASGPSARNGGQLVNEKGEPVGTVTSGCPSPSLSGQNIAMAYVKPSHSKLKTPLTAMIRGKGFEYKVAKMPFVPSQYYVK